eukprot:1243898-Pyramimonas_sp.AAC.1
MAPPLALPQPASCPSAHLGGGNSSQREAARRNGDEVTQSGVPCREPRNGGQCKRGSDRAPDLTGSCRARGALARTRVQNLAGSCRILQDPARPD